MRLKADSASGYRFAAIATLASAVAGITMLAGIVQLRVPDLTTRPLVQPEPVPDPGWPQQWLHELVAVGRRENHPDDEAADDTLYLS